jgi:glycosyltransferase involved in cell wall biosynthesis
VPDRPALRIAFVCYGPLARVSGGNVYDRHLVAALRDRGARVEVIELPSPRSWAAALADNARRALIGPGAWDVVVEDELCHPSLLRANRAFAAAGVPVVALVHNLASLQPGLRGRAARRACERAYLRGVTAVIAVCARTREDVLALAGPRPSVIAYAGRDHVARTLGAVQVQARAAEPGPLRVLHAAVVAPHKGVDRLLRALARVEPPWTLEVAGALDRDEAYVRRTTALAHALGLADRVRWLGELRGAALADAYARAQVFALPSSREAFSLACLDAFAFGLPVLSTDVGGSGELVTDGVDGALLAPDDVGAWARRLTELARDRALLARAGIRALERHARQPTWNATAEAVLRFVTGLAAGASLPGSPSRARTARASAS